MLRNTHFLRNFNIISRPNRTGKDTRGIKPPQNVKVAKKYTADISVPEISHHVRSDVILQLIIGFIFFFTLLSSFSPFTINFMLEQYVISFLLYCIIFVYFIA